MLPAFAVCECQQCERHRASVVMYHTYYPNNSANGYAPYCYTIGLNSPSWTDPMCSGGCETHGECADAGMTCGECGECDALCSCEKCEHCGGLAGECECCEYCGSSYCDGPCGECECCECECHDSSYCDCDDCQSGQSGGMGQISEAPWVRRGYQSTGHTYAPWHQIWGVDRETDLCQSAADFYLLEALAGGVVNHGAPTDPYLLMLRSEAKSLLTPLVASLDRTFRGYVDAIIGGELRHHKAAGSLNRSGGRKDAWIEWHAIRESQGTAALDDAVELFLDFNVSGYGGEKWAEIARVLLARETGRISPLLFIDRVFNLQHNGGTLFDKGTWGVRNSLGWGYYELNSYILPAHGRCPESAWTVLLAAASPEVRDLFQETWRACNRAKASMLMPVRRAPGSRLPMESHTDVYYGTTKVYVDTVKVYQLLQHA